MIISLLNKNAVNILTYLAISPGSKYTRIELKEKTKMNNLPLDETISQLLSLKILKKEKNIYSLNLEQENTNKIIELIKKEYNSFNLEYKIFIILLEISDRLSKIKNIESIMLFGSYAKLIHTEKSDIDIAIINKESLKDIQKNRIKSILNKISKKEGKIIQAHFITSKELKENSKDNFIKDILRNGKSLF